MKEELKAWCQRHHCEALAQLAVFGPAREALRRDASVVPALEAVAAAGLSAEIREVAAAALMALSDKELEIKAEGQKHVMLSCASIVLVQQCIRAFVAAARSSLHDCCFGLLFVRRNCVWCKDQWDVQATIMRVNGSLITRGYVTWFDLTNMKGE